MIAIGNEADRYNKVLEKYPPNIQVVMPGKGK